MSIHRSPLVHQKSLPQLLSNVSEENKPHEFVDTKFPTTGKTNKTGRTMMLVKTYSMIEKVSEKKVSVEQSSLFQQLTLKPSFVAQIESETQKIVNTVTAQLELEKSKNKALSVELEEMKANYSDLLHDNNSLRAQIDKMKLELDTLSQRYTETCQELIRVNRYSKDSTDDTISSSEAGRYAEICTPENVSPERLHPECFYDSVYQVSLHYSSGSSESILLPENEVSKHRKLKKLPIGDKNLINQDIEDHNTVSKKSPKFTDVDLGKGSSDESSESGKRREKKPSSLKLRRKKKTSDKSFEEGRNANGFKSPNPHEKKRRKERLHDESFIRNRSSSIDGSKSTNSNKVTLDNLGSIYTKIEDQWVLNYDEFLFVDELGKGNASTVYYGTYKDKKVAIKVLRSENQPREIEDFKKEMQIMSSIRSPYIVHFYGASLQPKLCIVLEHCPNSTLFHFMQNEANCLDWNRSLQWMLEMLQGVNALHEWTTQVVHRDLKTLNILLDADLKVKVCDFGLSRFVSGEHDQKTFFKMRGTYAYIPPEVYKGKPFTSKSDIYSIGIILWEMIYRIIEGKHMRPYGEYPFIIHDFQIIIQAATKGLRPSLPPQTPPELEKIYLKCIDQDPDVRPTCVELIDEIKSIQQIYKENKSSWDSVVKDMDKIRRQQRRELSWSPKKLARKVYTRDLKMELDKLGLRLNREIHDKRVSTNDLKIPVEIPKPEDSSLNNRSRSVSHSFIKQTFEREET